MRISHALLTAALLTAAPALAQTQTPVDKAQGVPTARSAAVPAAKSAAKPDQYHAMLEQRITSMRQRLHITPAEQTDWSAFAQTMRDNAENIEAAYQKRSDAMNTMTAPENLRNYGQIQQQRGQDVEKLADSFDTLYGQLSDPQKKTADAMFRQYEVQHQQAHQAAAHAKPQ